MQIVRILDAEGKIIGRAVVALASSMVIGQAPQCSVITQYMGIGNTHSQCAAFIDGYNMRKDVETLADDNG